MMSDDIEDGQACRSKELFSVFSKQNPDHITDLIPLLGKVNDEKESKNKIHGLSIVFLLNNI